MASQFTIQKSEEEWKSVLSTEEYEILRNKETEDAGTGEYDKFYPTEGFFKCRACGNPIYSASAKFDSGCGWPAFDKCFKNSIVTDLDEEYNMIEIMCSSCGGHLGHIFLNENHTATNERHCVNSRSLRFDKGTFQAEESKLITHFKGKYYGD